MFNRKFSSNIRLKRRMIRSTIILLVVCLGLGYSAFTTNLGISGTLNVSEYEGNTLYGVLKKAANQGTYAKEYTGQHRDSYTVEPTKKIYHWYAPSTTAGNALATEILDKNNVIFADQCWQMIRTTDTGGVKMIYNGEAENNQCINTRGNHIGYKAETASTSIYPTYYYGTSYTYDKANNLFSLAGTITTGTIQLGQYTCRQTTSTGTCSTLYIVDSYRSGESYYNVTPLNNTTSYYQIGVSKYSNDWQNLSNVGYMNGTKYSIGGTSQYYKENFSQTETLFNNSGYSTSYWFGEDITYSSNNYSLTNTFKITSTSQYSQLVGKYTLKLSSENGTSTSAYYIVGATSSKIYYVEINNGNLLSAYEPILLGDSITDNGNGTYTVNNTTPVSLLTWYNGRSTSWAGKYTCLALNTCANPKYIGSLGPDNFKYISIDPNEKILIAKSASGLTLTDTLLVRKDELVINRSNYSSYKYTCNTTSNICTAETIRRLYGISSDGYNYLANYYYGSSATWNGTNYTLVNPVHFDEYNSTNYHYKCDTIGTTTCSKTYYIYYKHRDEIDYHVELHDGAASISNAFSNAFSLNTSDSLIKDRIERWYSKYLLPYDNYLEDTIFCNNRNPENYWTDTSYPSSDIMPFQVPEDLSCQKNTDKFCTSNPSARINYKIGLFTYEEMNLLNNNQIRRTGTNYWLMTPMAYVTELFGNGVDSLVNITRNTGDIVFQYDDEKEPASTTNPNGIRPAISLKPGTEYVSGTGSMADPYIVE